MIRKLSHFHVTLVHSSSSHPQHALQLSLRGQYIQQFKHKYELETHIYGQGGEYCIIVANCVSHLMRHSIFVCMFKMLNWSCSSTVDFAGQIIPKRCPIHTYNTGRKVNMGLHELLCHCHPYPLIHQHRQSD